MGDNNNGWYHYCVQLCLLKFSNLFIYILILNFKLIIKKDKTKSEAMKSEDYLTDLV